MQVHAGRWIDSVHQRSRDHAGNRNAHSKSWPTNVGFDESPSGCDFTLKFRNSSHPGIVSHTTRSRESPNEEESMIDSDFANAHGFWIVIERITTWRQRQHYKFPLTRLRRTWNPQPPLNPIRLPHSPTCSGSKEDVPKGHLKQTGSGRRKNSQPHVERRSSQQVQNALRSLALITGTLLPSWDSVLSSHHQFLRSGWRGIRQSAATGWTGARSQPSLREGAAASRTDARLREEISIRKGELIPARDRLPAGHLATLHWRSSSAYSLSFGLALVRPSFHRPLLVGQLRIYDPTPGLWWSSEVTAISKG